jgi:hypothetical protein
MLLVKFIFNFASWSNVQELNQRVQSILDKFQELFGEKEKLRR